MKYWRKSPALAVCTVLAALSVLIFGISLAVDSNSPASEETDFPVQNEDAPKNENSSYQTPDNTTELNTEDEASDSTTDQKGEDDRDDQQPEDEPDETEELDETEDETDPPSNEGDADEDETAPPSSEETTPDPEPDSEKTYLYVGSSERDKYHFPTCRWVKNIKDENLIYFQSKEDAVSKGYSPCGTCKP